MDTALPVSVIICTYNRADRLCLALEALQKQTLPQDQFEVIVVDNASTDDTQEVCNRYLTQLSNLHYHYESIQGLSRARNQGLEVAKGRIAAYLDDDAIPSPQWLQALLQGFETIEPEPVAVGGAILPLWEVAPPVWMHRYVQGYYTVLDFGSVPRWFPPGEFPYGADRPC
ncbi:MAG: glycosyltransferase family 2 protein [Leptolyngbya sp. SIO1D8]|nr:glycosyltransferase family 2 protein [Leptolyngbya sp. SIO1D8]